MNRRLLVAAATLVVIALAAWIAASPVFALQALRGAAQRGDARALEQLVDFPSVRESLKSQVKAQLLGSMREEPAMRDNPLGAFALAIAPALTDTLVDSAVTPETIAALVREGDARALETAAEPAAPPAAPAAPRPRPDPPEVSYGYRDFGTFAATYRGGDAASKPVSLVLERRGLFGWRLVRIELQPALLAD